MSVESMGLRSFVALPVDKDGKVIRIQYQRNADTDTDVLVANLAYGLSSKQTLLFGLPYRLTPEGADQLGNLSVLYRHIVLQDDSSEGTRRLGLLGGIVVPTKSNRETQLQLGAVATIYQQRMEWDFDVLWIAGLDNTKDRARYDIAWQYRLSPAVYPDWGISNEWHVDLELGGRWIEQNTMVHQVTVALQSVHRQWVFEGGIIQDLNEQNEVQYILSSRYHF